jgi:hypothetical protein
MEQNTQQNAGNTNDFMVQLLGINWRTSLTGYATSAFLILQPIITNGDFDIKRDWKQCVFALLAAIYGKVSKDAKTTGLPTDAANQPKQ